VVLPVVQRCIVGLEGQAGHWTSSVHLVCLVLNVRPMEMEESEEAPSYPMLVKSMYRQDLATLCISEASTPVFQDSGGYPQIRVSRQLLKFKHGNF
jgi:hypothetical protein